MMSDEVQRKNGPEAMMVTLAVQLITHHSSLITRTSLITQSNAI